MPINLIAGASGLPKLVLTHGSGASAELYLYGAHVVSWIPGGGSEILFLSRKSSFQQGTAIRGGVPVIFPQFATAGPLPKHGFARTRPWQWIKEASVDDDSTSVKLQLKDSPDTRSLWPHAFVAELTLELGQSSLTTRLSIVNPGPDSFSMTAALHAYLRVADVTKAIVTGLEGVRYWSVPEGPGEHQDVSASLTVAGEIDRTYLDAPSPVVLDDRAGGRTVRIESEGFQDVVVWNPWITGAAALPDMVDEEYREMLCIEAAQVGRPIELAAGASWSGLQRLLI